jgi:hypothetical protein
VCWRNKHTWGNPEIFLNLPGSVDILAKQVYLFDMAEAGSVASAHQAFSISEAALPTYGSWFSRHIFTQLLET